ncbi:MAG TPA: hypothetical protein V6D11_26315 [Waterburya sp.]
MFRFLNNCTDYFSQKETNFRPNLIQFIVTPLNFSLNWKMMQSLQKFLLEANAVSHTQDPLIDWRGEETIRIAVVFLIIALTILVRFLSPRLEHAVIFALVASLIAIAFFVIH